MTTQPAAARWARGSFPRGIASAIFVSVLPWHPASVRAGEIVGHVTIPQIAPETQNRKRYPGQTQGHEAVAPAPSRATVQDVVVYLEGNAPGTGRHPEPRLAQRGKSFVPSVLPIRAGTRVQFPNEDPFFHNVFSYSKNGSFDLGRYPQGQSRDQQFSTPGLVKVFCEIHSQMRGYILVLESDAFTVPTARGDYALTGIPPGRYKLVAWHPSREPKVQDVEVGSGLTPVDIVF